VAGLRERLERGFGMRAQRFVEGALIAAAILVQDPRPAYVVLVLLAMQVVTPLASPVALVWQLFSRRLRPGRLGDVYFDLSANRVAAVMSSAEMIVAFLVLHASRLGWLLFVVPCASCILSATVGFCAGCSYYVFTRDLLVKRRFIRGAIPEGASDVDLENQH
jgi:hypothetical protein